MIRKTSKSIKGLTKFCKRSEYWQFDEHADPEAERIAAVQRTAERIYIESNGKWGTPPGTPLPSYWDLHKS